MSKVFVIDLNVHFNDFHFKQKEIIHSWNFIPPFILSIHSIFSYLKNSFNAKEPLFIKPKIINHKVFNKFIKFFSSFSLKVLNKKKIFSLNQNFNAFYLFFLFRNCTSTLMDRAQRYVDPTTHAIHLILFHTLNYDVSSDHCLLRIKTKKVDFISWKCICVSGTVMFIHVFVLKRRNAREK